MTRLKLTDIHIDVKLQARCKFDGHTVIDYADAIKGGAELPPVIVFDDGKVKWLADGFHRVAAHKRIPGKNDIEADVRKGTRADAAWYALGANREHGLRLSNADKQRAVKLALKARPNESSRAIAEHIGVSHVYVEKRRQVVTVTTSTKARTGRDGKQYPPTPAVAVGPGRYDMSPVIADDPPPVVSHERPPVKDQLGTIITVAQVADIFWRDDELVEITTALDRIKTAVLKQVEAKDPLFTCLTASAWKADITNTRNGINAARPYAVCPACEGKGCKDCQKRGWLNKLSYGAVPLDKR
jgi:hypothetical protein